MLLMRKIYFDAIRSGVKTTTLRYWRSCRIRPDSVHRVPGLGNVRIQDVRVVQPGQLTDADARADGFDGLAALQAALDQLYPPNRRKGRRLYQVHFALLPTAGQGP